MGQGWPTSSGTDHDLNTLRRTISNSNWNHDRFILICALSVAAGGCQRDLRFTSCPNTPVSPRAVTPLAISNALNQGLLCRTLAPSRGGERVLTRVCSFRFFSSVSFELKKRSDTRLPACTAAVVFRSQHSVPRGKKNTRLPQQGRQLSCNDSPRRLRKTNTPESRLGRGSFTLRRSTTMT